MINPGPFTFWNRPQNEDHAALVFPENLDGRTQDHQNDDPDYGGER